MQLPADEERPWTSIVADAVLIAGGALMVIGSFSPWTYSTIGYATQTPFTVYRNGMELGFKNGFSVAGLITAIFGGMGVLSGSLQLAHRHPPRPLIPIPFLYGLVGVSGGLYATGEASWFAHQLTEGYPTAFAAGAAYGIWLLLFGASAMLALGVLTMPVSWIRHRIFGASVALVAVAVTTFALAPN